MLSLEAKVVWVSCLAVSISKASCREEIYFFYRFFSYFFKIFSDFRVKQFDLHRLDQKFWFKTTKFLSTLWIGLQSSADKEASCNLLSRLKFTSGLHSELFLSIRQLNFKIPKGFRDLAAFRDRRDDFRPNRVFDLEKLQECKRVTLQKYNGSFKPLAGRFQVNIVHKRRPKERSTRGDCWTSQDVCPLQTNCEHHFVNSKFQKLGLYFAGSNYRNWLFHCSKNRISKA